MELERERENIHTAPDKDFKNKPENLLAALNALKPQEVMLFIQENCAPGSEIFEQCRKYAEAFKYIDSQPPLLTKQYIACFALITDNIAELPQMALMHTISYVKRQYPDYHLNESLNWIRILSAYREDLSMIHHLMKHINKNTPCYMNYSGLFLGAICALEDVDFSNSMYRNMKSQQLGVKNCDFSNINWSGSSILSITGEGNAFTGAICENMTFLSAEDVSTEVSAKATFDRLHTFLSQSKGRDTLKAAILKDIIAKIKTLEEDSQERDDVELALVDHPLVAEHRNSLLKMVSLTKTNSQKLVMEEFGIIDADDEVVVEESGLSPFERLQNMINESAEEGFLSSVREKFSFNNSNEESSSWFNNNGEGSQPSILSRFSMNFSWFGNKKEESSYETGNKYDQKY